MESVDAVVIGGGVVGLAVARQLATLGRDVLLLEEEASLGMHTSSRNSEVIHAGIYYPKDSLKARLCVQGKSTLYAYLEANEVPFQRIGKVIVATRDEELPVLEGILKQAAENGVGDLTRLSRDEVKALEPSVNAVGGLFSPSTGIVDSHALMASLRRDAVQLGATLLCSTPVLRGQVTDSGIALSIGGPEPTEVVARLVVNAAGLKAPDLAGRFEGLEARFVPVAHFAKGHYFVLSGKSPFRHLVYPVPEPGGLGVHVTLDLAGQTRFGPDVSWVSSVDYSFDDSRSAAFCRAIRRYFPSLDEGAMAPGYTGIRPKLGPQGSPAQDFVIQGPNVHGVGGLVNLFGIESPGLTASLAIAEHVCRLLNHES